MFVCVKDKRGPVWIMRERERERREELSKLG